LLFGVERIVRDSKSIPPATRDRSGDFARSPARAAL